MNQEPLQKSKKKFPDIISDCNREASIKMKFKVTKQLVLLLVCLVWLIEARHQAAEDNDIDRKAEYHRHKLHRHRKHRMRPHSSHRRLHRNRGLRVRAPMMSFNNEESEYDMRTTYPIPVVNVTAKVGESVILNCAVNSSYGSNPGVS